VAVLLPLAAVGAALISQHVFDMLPCPWCVLQRVIFLAISLVALVAGLVRSPASSRVGALLMLLLAGCGVAAALWQHFVAASSASCNLTLADRIISGLGLGELAPQVFVAWASCADAAVKLLGLPYEFYSGALFFALGAAAVVLLRRPA
jgi:protein dithiol:quinone oxidoreductase